MDNDIKPSVTPAPQTPAANSLPATPVYAAPDAANTVPAGEVYAPTPSQPKGRSSKWRSTLSTLLVILIAPALALSITAFVFQSYQVDGQSMGPTLNNGDRLIIWKIPRTWSRLTGRDYIPKRGDVVVFVKRGLYEGSSNKEKQLIKRVLALPGERITVTNGGVTVYNSKNPSGFNPDKLMPYGKDISVTDGNVDTTLAAGEVFVVGDNRGNSLDSRYFGAIPSEDIVGRLIARVLPLSEAKRY